MESNVAVIAAMPRDLRGQRSCSYSVACGLSNCNTAQAPQTGLEEHHRPISHIVKIILGKIKKAVSAKSTKPSKRANATATQT